MTSYLEKTLYWLIKDEKLPLPVANCRIHEKRKWLCDFIWFDQKLVCEVEGGEWVTKDCEKYNELVLQGFRLLRVTKKHIMNGAAIEWIKRGLNINIEP